MAYGKTIELYLVNGTADSLVTAELSNWNGKAIKIPRLEVQSCTRDDITQAGVYFLFCKEDDDTDSVYIGESENVKDRLIQHIRDYHADNEAYYWTTAVIFIGRDLNKTLIRYLENRLVEIAKSCKRYKILTKNTYQNTVMKESDIAVMEEFIDDIKVVINALGYKVLEPLVQHNPTNPSDDDLLYINTGAAKATGKTTTEGFVVLQGSIINQKTNSNSLNARIANLREKWISEEKVKDLATTEDLLFSSSSAAADFVLGYSVSGPRAWKDKNGKSLKEIEAENNE
ncbi:GIY-YIG nuclease family protein [Limosilactobacillus mucosae]|uniref:GIY-YIG nuclease family protein n=1 Tax=Limosilactobacillus mucosae TaxID=97478 RepID=UPI00399202F0